MKEQKRSSLVWRAMEGRSKEVYGIKEDDNRPGPGLDLTDFVFS